MKTLWRVAYIVSIAALTAGAAMLFWDSRTGLALPATINIATALCVIGLVGTGVSYFFFKRSG